jgi:hypothetical protein
VSAGTVIKELRLGDLTCGPSRGIQPFGAPAISRHQTTIAIGAEEGILHSIPDTQEPARSLVAMSSGSESDNRLQSYKQPHSGDLSPHGPYHYMFSDRYYLDNPPAGEQRRLWF